jgi:hypothetical protein
VHAAHAASASAHWCLFVCSNLIKSKPSVSGGGRGGGRSSGNRETGMHYRHQAKETDHINSRYTSPSNIFSAEVSPKLLELHQTTRRKLYDFDWAKPHNSGRVKSEILDFPKSKFQLQGGYICHELFCNIPMMYLIFHFLPCSASVSSSP